MTDLELMYLLKENGYEASLENLMILKEEMENEATLEKEPTELTSDIDNEDIYGGDEEAAEDVAEVVVESYSDYELYQLLEANGYTTTTKNLEILKEGLYCGKYEILDEARAEIKNIESKGGKSSYEYKVATPEIQRRYDSYEKGREAGKVISQSRKASKKGNDKLASKLSDKAIDIVDDGRSSKVAARNHHMHRGSRIERSLRGVGNIYTGNLFNRDAHANRRTIRAAYDPNKVRDEAHIKIRDDINALRSHNKDRRA